MRIALAIIAVCLLILVVALYPRAGHFHGHGRMVDHAVISPNTKYIASGSLDDRTIRIWEIATRKQLAVLANSERPTTFEFSPDSKMLATIEPDNTIALWNAADGKEQPRLRGHKDTVLSVAFSPDGNTLASSSRDQTVKVWDLGTTKELLTFQTKAIRSLAYSPDGKLLACGDWEYGQRSGSVIQIRDANTGKELRSIKTSHRLLDRLLFSPDGAILCEADLGALTLWNVADGTQRYCECPRWFDNDDDATSSLVFSPDGRLLVAGNSKAIGLWDVASGKNTQAYTTDGPNRYLNYSDRIILDPEEWGWPSLASAAFKPNGDLMVVGTRFETVAIWKLTSVQLNR